MERAELSDTLRAWRSRPPAGDGKSPATVCEAAPEKFMSALANAVAGRGDIFLLDPRWGAHETAEVAALIATPVPDPRPSLGYLMIPTGGTSGRVRFARHDADTIGAAALGFARHFGLTRVNAAGVLPLHHVSGLMAWMRCALTSGTYLPLDWKAVEGGLRPALPPSADGWTISLVPTQLERLLKDGAATAWLRRFRLICLGGAPAWPGLLDAAASQRLPVSTGYGLTETAAMVTALAPEDFLAGQRSCGPALPHAVVTIDQDGTVVVAAASLFRGYFPEWRPTGAFVTGDGGRLDDAGHLLVSGRRDAIIISGGEKVDPAEVEAVLRGTGEMVEVVVLGLPDAEWGQAVVAAFPATMRPDLARVAAAVARALAPAKRPRRYLPIAPWPGRDQGKVDRSEVARLAQAAVGIGPTRP